MSISDRNNAADPSSLNDPQNNKDDAKDVAKDGAQFSVKPIDAPSQAVYLGNADDGSRKEAPVKIKLSVRPHLDDGKSGTSMTRAMSTAQMRTERTAPATPTGLEHDTRSHSLPAQSPWSSEVDISVDNVDRNMLTLVPHIEQGFVSIRLICTRLVRHFYSQLRKLCDDLPAMNNTSRKRKILEFLIESRKQFIKLIVICRWTQSAPEIRRCIDLVAWMQTKKVFFQNTVHALQNVRHHLQFAQVRAADLVTSLSVLSTGTFSPLKSSEVFQTYQRCQPISIERAVEVIQRLNSMLSLRLLLYEAIPAPFANYEVVCGRVKFSVAGEFELCLTFADEESSAGRGRPVRWFLVSFKLLFQPQNNEKLFAEVETVANEVLAHAALNGKHQLVEIYRFAHNFALSRRLNIFLVNFYALKRSNELSIAFDFSFDKENESLKVEYWTEQTILRGSEHIRADNSFKLSIERNKTPSNVERYTSSRRKYQFYDRSFLKLEWFPEGSLREIDTERILDLTAAQFLMQIIGRHSKLIMKRLFPSLSNDPTFADCVELKEGRLPSKTSRDEDIVYWFIFLHLTPLDAVRIYVNQSSGRFILNEQSEMFHGNPYFKKAEKSLNSDDFTAIIVLSRLRTALIQSYFESNCRLNGWNMHRLSSQVLSMKELHRFMMRNHFHLQFFSHTRFRAEDGDQIRQWFIVADSEQSEMRWWLVLMHFDRLMTTHTWSIDIAEPIDVKRMHGNSPLVDVFPNFWTLLLVRRAYWLLQSACTLHRIPCTFARGRSITFGSLRIAPLLINWDFGRRSHFKCRVAVIPEALQAHAIGLKITVLIRDFKTFDINQAQVLDSLESESIGTPGALEAMTMTFSRSQLDFRHGCATIHVAAESAALLHIKDEISNLEMILDLLQYPRIQGVFYSVPLPQLVDTQKGSQTSTGAGDQAANEEIDATAVREYKSGTEAEMVIRKTIHYDVEKQYAVTIRANLVAGRPKISLQFSSGSPHARLRPFFEEMLQTRQTDIRGLIIALRLCQQLLEILVKIEKPLDDDGPEIEFVARTICHFRVFFSFSDGRFFNVYVQINQQFNEKDTETAASDAEADISPQVEYFVGDATALNPQKSSEYTEIPLFRQIAEEGLDLGDDEMNGSVTPDERGITIASCDLAPTILKRVFDLIISDGQQ